MNSLDLFDYTVPTAQETITRNTDGLSSVDRPTLNDEVNEVMGQLGKFWGGFRKQVRDHLNIGLRHHSSNYSLNLFI